LPDTLPSNELISAQPKIEEFSIDGRLNGTLDDIKAVLGKLPFYLITSEAAELTMIKVESRNINKKPYLFHVIKIRPENILVTYSLIPDTSVDLRRAGVLKELSMILSMISERYVIDQSKFIQYVDSVLESLVSGLSQTYTTLYNHYDSMLTDYRELKRLNIEIAASNRNLTLQSAQLEDENKTLKEQLSTLQKYSDETLMALVEDWITVHNSSIDVVGFAKEHSVSPTRVEQILDRMVSLGYIELKS
jgi:hypothetical protein